MLVLRLSVNCPVQHCYSWGNSFTILSLFFFEIYFGLEITFFERSVSTLLLWNENDGQYDGRSLMLAESSLGTDVDEYRATSLAAALAFGMATCV